MKLQLRCYICGDKLSGVFVLTSQGTNTDRCFVVDEKCIPRLDKCYTQKVQKVKRP